MGRVLKVALAGNPNSGKTTIFNRLTGARQRVGNYPGVTVEKKTGTLRYAGVDIELVDLPGTYSLSAVSLEEEVARDFILEERPDVVVDVVDASNLERNLYLAVQLMEMGVPLILAFNVWDEAVGKGQRVDVERLSSIFGAPVIPTVGHRGRGMRDLLDAMLRVGTSDGTRAPLRVDYGPDLEREIGRVESILSRNGNGLGANARWTAVKLIEGDRGIRRRVLDAAGSKLDRLFRELDRSNGDGHDLRIAERRYLHVTRVCEQAVVSAEEEPGSLTERIDAVVLHRYLAVPLFLGLMYLVFQFTFTLGAAPVGWIEGLFGSMAGAVGGLWPAGSDSLLRSLLVDGVIGGVGGVLVFLPNILLLFLAIAILEDSGYMARAAFIMDRVMHKVGLPGKSFIPLLTGFGCSVPAIMATRTLESERDRLTTMLVVPLMSCGARLPIYVLIIPAFFAPRLQAPVLWSIYVIGILMAVGFAKLLRSTLFRGPATPLVMELPPYRVPPPRSFLLHTWERGRLYIKKAAGLILGISIIMWALTTFPTAPSHSPETAALSPPVVTQETVGGAGAGNALAHSFAGRIGRGLEPAISPMGFDWRIGTALIGAFAAKEVFVAQMGIIFSLEGADEESGALREMLRQSYSPLTAFCILLFCLISAPCMATVVMTRRESGSLRWALFQFGGLTAVAFVLTTAVYQLGRLLGIGVL